MFIYPHLIAKHCTKYLDFVFSIGDTPLIIIQCILGSDSCVQSAHRQSRELLFIIILWPHDRIKRWLLENPYFFPLPSLILCPAREPNLTFPPHREYAHANILGIIQQLKYIIVKYFYFIEDYKRFFSLSTYNWFRFHALFLVLNIRSTGHIIQCKIQCKWWKSVHVNTSIRNRHMQRYLMCSKFYESK